MRLKVPALSRYHPRLISLVAFLLIAAVLVLSNLTFVVRKIRHGDPTQGVYLQEKAYGWPFAWRGLVFAANMLDGFGAFGWHYSAHHLAANFSLWLLMLVVPASICEWLLRRYPLRLRWSLRTMMMIIAAVAACCCYHG